MIDAGRFEQEGNGGNGAGPDPLFPRLPPVEFGGQESYCTEKRGFVLFVLILTGFVIMAMQYGWTDSYRMELGVPYSQSKPGAVQ